MSKSLVDSDFVLVYDIVDLSDFISFRIFYDHLTMDDIDFIVATFIIIYGWNLFFLFCLFRRLLFHAFRVSMNRRILLRLLRGRAIFGRSSLHFNVV